MPQRVHVRLVIAAMALAATCGSSPASTVPPAGSAEATTLALQVQWRAYEYDPGARPYYAPQERWRENRWRRERWLQQQHREEEARRAEWRRRNGQWQQRQHDNWDEDEDEY